MREREVEGKKPYVISAAALKGGVGKTRAAMLLANYFGAVGKRVLLIDFDMGNNSSTLYYADTREKREAAYERKNAYFALSDIRNGLGDYTLETPRKGVSLIASDVRMNDNQTIETRRLKRLVPLLGGSFDYVIIDCAPSYSNFMVNALNAADMILIPVLRETDSFNTAKYLENKIKTEVDGEPRYGLLLNGCNTLSTGVFSHREKEYIDQYLKHFEGHVLPPETWFPYARNEMAELKDKRRYLSALPSARLEMRPREGVCCHEKLYHAVRELAECFMEEEGVERPEAF